MIFYTFHEANFRQWFQQKHFVLVDMDEININKHKYNLNLDANMVLHKEQIKLQTLCYESGLLK